MSNDRRTNPAAMGGEPGASVSAIANFITLLKQEEEECGELWRIVRRQHENLLTRAIDAILSTAAELDRKTQALNVTRQQRDMAQRSAASALGTEVSFSRLLPALPADARVEVETLVERTNQKLQAIRSAAAENERLAHASLPSSHEKTREVQLQQALQKL